MSDKFDKLKPYLKKNMAISTALSILSWDTETLAPEEAIEYTSKVIGTLSKEYFNSINNDDVKSIIKDIDKDIVSKSIEFTEIELAIYYELKKNVEKLENIPENEYGEYSELVPKANNIWAKAKENNKFEDFAPIFSKVIEFSQRFASYRAKDNQHPYNVLLEDFEEGFTMEVLDDFFDKVKSEVIPLLKLITEKNNSIDKNYNKKSYDVGKQREFSTWLAEYVGFDYKRGVFAESEHPFTTGFHNHDIRITTHYYERNLESAIFSTIHEVGHGIYEQGIQDSITQTIIGEGTSSGMHESQSRFYENIIGRSHEFWKPIYKKLQELYPDNLENIDLTQFIKGINKAEPGLIRIEADELTYCLHIIVRYEVEKMIFNNEVSVAELPSIWNDKYEEYLGLTPETDTEGILQDIHWSWGEFGYFPSYAVGNAIAAQIYYHMKKVMPFDNYLIEGKLDTINQYLREHIHKFGKMKNTNEILLEMTGEGFNPKYYITYLKDKFKRIYDL